MVLLALIIASFIYLFPKLQIGEVSPISHGFSVSNCEGMKTEHLRFDVLSGGHNCAVVTCDQCHVGGFYGGSAPNTCIGCHMGGRNTATVKPPTHIRTDAISCDACHSASSNSFLGAKMNHTIVVSQACSSCHGVSPSVRGKPNNHVPTILDCATCHTSKSWDAHFDHIKAGVTPTTCNTCHTSGVSGAVKKPTNHIPTTESCDSCHTGYSTFNNGTLNHSGVTASAVQCEACHTGNKLGATMKGPQHIANVGNCASCHQYPIWQCKSGHNDKDWFNNGIKTAHTFITDFFS